MNLENNTVAAQILEQLGGNRFRVMTGSNFFTHGTLKENGRWQYLQMHLKRNKSGANRLRIALDPDRDLYEVEFFRVAIHRSGEVSVETVKYLNDVYGEDLQRIFKMVTGFETQM